MTKDTFKQGFLRVNVYLTDDRFYSPWRPFCGAYGYGWVSASKWRKDPSRFCPTTRALGAGFRRPLARDFQRLGLEELSA